MYIGFNLDNRRFPSATNWLTTPYPLLLMAKTLNHYSQQIKALAPDAVALDRAKQLGDLLISAKAAVKAANKLWTDWLQTDCDLSPRTAGRMMTIAKRWDDPAFVNARNSNPKLAIREADKVLAANSTRKSRGKETRQQREWKAAFEDRIAYDGWVCTCGNHLTAQKGVVPYCAGTKTTPHKPRPMVAEAQDGYLLHFVDLSSYTVANELVAVANQLRSQLPEATYFSCSAGGGYLRVSNALDASQLVGISIKLKDGGIPFDARLGGITENFIECVPGGMLRDGETEHLEATAQKVMAAFGWEG